MTNLLHNLILNLYIVYELNNWLRNPSNSFPLKNCLFGTVKLVRDAVKSKYTYNDWGKAFDGDGDLVVFGVDNTSWSHTDNNKNFLALREGPTGSTGEQNKNLILNLVKQTQNFQ